MKIIKKIIQSLWESFKVTSLIVTAFASFFVVLYGAVWLYEYSFTAFIVAVIIAAFVGIAICEFVERMKKKMTRAELEDKILKERVELIKDERAKKVARFLLGYSFYDKKEVYTNGTLLVPMFRVLDALDMINMDNIGYSTI